MKRHSNSRPLAVATFAICVLFLATSTLNAQFDLTWFTVDGGGGNSLGATFELNGAIGQVDAGAMSGGSFELNGGFWAATDSILLGDVNLDDVINLLDIDPFIDRLVNGSFQAEADCNQDGVVNLLDVGIFVAILSSG